MFFGYSKMYSVTAILFDLGLPSFDTFMHNYRYSYREQWLTSLKCCYSGPIPQKYRHQVYVDFYCVFLCCMCAIQLLVFLVFRFFQVFQLLFLWSYFLNIFHCVLQLAVVCRCSLLLSVRLSVCLLFASLWAELSEIKRIRYFTIRNSV